MPRGRINLVVMGTPRSGTTYMAHVLNACGLRCFHQQYFRPGPCPPAWRYDGKYGEVSPAAYTLRQNIPQGALVLHQVRNPIDVVNSLFYTGHCQWDANGAIPARVGFSQRAWDLLYLRAVRGIKWDIDRMRRCAQFWDAYNNRMREYVTNRSGWTYRVEDVDVALIARIFQALRMEPDTDRIKEVIEGTRRDLNRLTRDPARVFDWDHMTRGQIAQAAQYGYVRGRCTV